MKNVAVTLDSKEFKKSEKFNTHVDLKSGNGTLFIDVRKWFKPGNLDQFVSSSKGIMLEISDWKIIIPMIQEFINENDKD